MKRVLAVLCLLVTIAAGARIARAQTAGRTGGAGSQQADIALALSAAPASVGARAAVIRMDDSGRMTELRRGDNGWTCMPRDPGSPVDYPVCVDQNGLAWYRAVMSGRDPDRGKVGYSYMLQGGSSWSNVDPTATKLPPGEKTHITIPPHIMIMNARLAEESGFPSGQAHPDTHRPFVAYGGTPSAILIIPVK
jgi:hypothetical protein